MGIDGAGWLWMTREITKGIGRYWLKTRGRNELNVENIYTFTYMYIYWHMCMYTHEFIFMHFHKVNYILKIFFCLKKRVHKNWVQVNDPPKIPPLNFFLLLFLKISISPFSLPRVNACDIKKKKNMLQNILSKMSCVSQL